MPETEEKKLFFKAFEDGKIKWKMCDPKSDFHGVYYKRIKDVKIELDSKEIVPMDDHSKRYGYRYKYRLVPDPNAKFKRSELINVNRLVGEYIYETIEEKPKKL